MLRILAGIVILVLSGICFSEEKVEVKALLKNMAVIEYKGVRRTLRAGQLSPEGIKLISADSKKGAIIELNGKRQVLGLSRQVGGGTYTPPEKRVVRIASDGRGHYFTPGRINNRPVKFLVDTGATSVAMNSIIANQLGLDYKSGQKINVNTASGVTTGYIVRLDSVAVGDVKVNHVEAVVNEGEFPAEILLGNTYLSRVELKVDSGVLVLESRL